MWELDYKEGWALKNLCFWTVVLGKTPKIPLDYKETKPFSPKENQVLIFIGRTDAEAEALIFWPPEPRNWLMWKDPDAGKDWRQEQKGTTEDEMGVGDGQRGLASCSPWGDKELDMTEWLNWTQLNCLHQVTDGGHLVSAIFFFSLKICQGLLYVVEWFFVCAQSCLTLCHPMDCSLPGPSVHGISQIRILEWVANLFI